MEVSRLTFTKETREKMNKPISHFKKGELRWAKLKEADSKGKLSLARNRSDIVRMLGGTGYGAEYSWISNMVSRGHLQEVLLGFSKNDDPEYEYHIISEPDYNFSRRSTGVSQRNAKIRKQKEEAAKLSAMAQHKEQFIEPSTTSIAIPVKESSSDELKIIIRYKDLTIEIENASSDIIDSIINKLSNE